jgi:hypothetical protein
MGRARDSLRLDMKLHGLSLAFLVAALVAASCATSRIQDPPPFEDVEAEVLGPQEVAFDALRSQIASDPAFEIEMEHRPDSIRVRRSGEPAIEVHVDHDHRVEAASPASGVATIVRVRRNIALSDLAEIRRWLTLALGPGLRAPIRTRPVLDPHSVVEIPITSTTSLPARIRHEGAQAHAAQGGGGTVYVRGHYRKNGSYVRPHTRHR